MNLKESSSDTGTPEQEAVVIPKITAKQFDAAFAEVASFLFEQYQKHKENAQSESSQKVI